MCKNDQSPPIIPVPSGGRQCKRLVKAFEVFDMENRTWSSLPSLLCKRSYSGVIWDSAGRLCWLGGLRQGGIHQSSKFTKNVNIFDTNQGKLARHTNTIIVHISVCLFPTVNMSSEVERALKTITNRHDRQVI